MEVEKLKERGREKSNTTDEELEVNSDLDMSPRRPNSPINAPASQNNRGPSKAVIQPTARASQKNHESSTIAIHPTARLSQNNCGLSTTVTNATCIRVGSYVVLKSLVNQNEIVATGILNEMGGVRVNGMVLGSAFCNVVVQSIVKENE